MTTAQSQARPRLVKAILVVTLGVAFVPVVLGAPAALGKLIVAVGWLIVAPVVWLLGPPEPLAQRIESVAEPQESDVPTPMESLRLRYAQGKISEEKFERKTTRLLENKAATERSTPESEHDPRLQDHQSEPEPARAR